MNIKINKKAVLADKPRLTKVDMTVDEHDYVMYIPTSMSNDNDKITKFVQRIMSNQWKNEEMQKYEDKVKAASGGTK